jgi:flagellin
MSLKISSDFSAMANSTLSQLHKHQSAMGKSIERVSTGYKVNGADDGSLKLYMTRKFDMKADEQAATNESMQVGASFLNMADKALNSIFDTLKQMRENALAVAQGTVTSSTTEFSQVQKDYASLAADIKSIVSNTKFNGKEVIGTTAKTLKILNDPTQGWETTFTIDALAGVANLASTNISTQAKAVLALKSDGVLGATMEQVSAAQRAVGTSLARINNMTTYLDDMAEVNTEARDTIRNADQAKEMTEYVRQNVLAQASQAMLSQANSGLASVLNLLS